MTALEILEKYNYKPITSNLSVGELCYVLNADGYILKVYPYRLLAGIIPNPFSYTNEFVIDNINKYIEKNHNTQVLLDNIFISSNSEMNWYCKIHDEHYKKSFFSFKNGVGGCPSCSRSQRAKSRTLKNEKIIEMFQSVYGNRYDYSKTVYKKAKEPVIITCRQHGDFLQTPDNHLRKNIGCPICDKSWGEKGESSNNFDGFKLYKIKCFDKTSNEVFYKIGRTYTSLNKRLNTSVFPYSWEVISIITGDPQYIYELEINLINRHIEEGLKYIPIKKFNGSTHECFFKLID